MDWILNELKAIPLIALGILIFFTGAVISDVFSGFVDKIFKR